MIQRVDFSESSLQAGETRPIAVWGDEPHQVTIRCFLNQPPPPGYRPCAECGTIVIQNGVTHYIEASSSIFGMYGGQLHVLVIDAAGDRRSFRLTVESIAEAGSPMAAV